MNDPIKLVFVDDSAFQQNLIQLLVDKIDIFDLFFVTSDGEELVQKLESSDELPEICILDFHMPNMGGVKAALEISIRFPSIKLFGYTATTNHCEIMEFKRNGGLHVFPKTDPASMLKKINSWICHVDVCDY